MRTTDLFKFNRSSKRLNESLEKTFGAKINFAEFDTTKLEDARNKLRTQIYDARSQTGFNEELENDTLSKAQFMHDAIVAELTDREEHIVDTTQTEGFGSLEDEVVSLLKRFDENANEIGGYGDPDVSKIIALLKQGNAEAAAEEVWDSYADQDGGEIRGIEPYIEDLQAEFEVLTQGGDESIETEAGRDAYQRDYDSSVSGMGRQERDWDEGDTEPANNFAVAINGKQWKVFKGRGRHADDMAERQHLRQLQDWAAKKSEATGKKWSVHVTGENPTESVDLGKNMNTNEAYINNADDAINLLAAIRKQSKQAELGQNDPVRPNQLVNDLWDVMQWIEHNMKESMETEKFDPLKHVKNPTQGEKDAAKDVKRGSYGDRAALLRSAETDGRLKKESINTGEDMRKLNEGEIQQASAIVTAKTMVDRVGRWIEELSGMENDTLLQLGDSIRDEMGQEQAKGFIEAVAPAIQQALENLKSTREALASGVRTLTGEEQPANMLGAEPAAPNPEGEMGATEPDAMNTDAEAGGDEFAAAEPAAGGGEESGREMRESINRQNRLMSILAN